MTSRKLIAVAIAALFAGSAFAAEVQLYGRIDEGLVYTHQDLDNGTDKTDEFKMRSGYSTGSRFGLTGTETLGNGWKVGFTLENGFNADDGSFADDDRLFNREATVSLTGGFGTLAFGRMGVLSSGNGTFGLAGELTPFGTGYGDYAVQSENFGSGYTRMDNMIAWKSPGWHGMNVYAQYSFKADNENENNPGAEGTSDADRYWAVGATYNVGQLKTVIVVDQVMWGTMKNPPEGEIDDSLAVTLGGSYDFGFMKPYVGLHWFDNQKTTNLRGFKTFKNFAGARNATGYMAEGYGVTLGTDVPLLGGTAKFAVGYLDAETDQDAEGDVLANGHDWTRYAASVGYTYNLSKRTSLYGVGSYAKDELKARGEAYPGGEPSTVEVGAGLVHKF